MTYHSYCSLFLIFLSACSLGTDERSAHIVSITDKYDTLIGRGVWSLDRVLTVAHVARACFPECRVVVPYRDGYIAIHTGTLSSYRDSAILPMGERYRVAPEAQRVSAGEDIYARVYRDEKWIDISGRVIRTESDYIGYDSMLVPTTYSGAVETDIILDAGESGTPIWTLSGELVGVLSAVDRGEKRSWVVR